MAIKAAAMPSSSSLDQVKETTYIKTNNNNKNYYGGIEFFS